ERSALRSVIDPAVSADDLLAVAEDTIPVFEASEDDLGLAQAWLHVAEAHWMRCSSAEVEGGVERAAVQARRAGADREGSGILRAIARPTIMGPRPVPDCARRCRELREAHTSPALRAECDFLIAWLEGMLGHFDEARLLLGQAKVVLADYGLVVRLASLQTYAGLVELCAGDPAAAERELRSGYEALAEMDERSYLSTLTGYLARAVVEQRRYDEADELTRVSEEAASQDDVISQVLWRQSRAKVAAARSEDEHAIQLGEEAVGLARETDFVNLCADSLQAHAVALEL